jgi:hypothetical protein
MIDEHVCLKNLHRILSEYSDDQNIKNLSINELQPMYQEIADNIFRISISNVHKFKNMLWNLDNLKSEIRLKFQKEIFDKWHLAYVASIKIELPEDRPETEEQNLIAISENESTAETAIQYPTLPTENSDIRQGQEPVQNGLDTGGSMLTGHVYKRDWFDKLLDVAASVTGCLSGMLGR